MTQVVIVIHLLLAIALIFVVLIQHSEGGGLGIGGPSGGGMGGFMTGRATANLLTRATAVLAAAFMLTSIVLALLADAARDRGSILDQPQVPANQQQAPPAPVLPSVPSVPTDR